GVAAVSKILPFGEQGDADTGSRRQRPLVTDRKPVAATVLAVVELIVDCPDRSARTKLGAAANGPHEDEAEVARSRQEAIAVPAPDSAYFRVQSCGADGELRPGRNADRDIVELCC